MGFEWQDPRYVWRICLLLNAYNIGIGCKCMLSGNMYFRPLYLSRSKSSEPILKGGGRKWFLTCMKHNEKDIYVPPRKPTTSKCITSSDSAWPELAHQNESGIRITPLRIVWQRSIASKNVFENSSQNAIQSGDLKRAMLHVQGLEVVMLTKHWKNMKKSIGLSQRNNISSLSYYNHI